MFDLFRSRDKAVRILLGGLLLLVALSMLTYLVPSYGTGANPSDTVIAEIGKETITVPEVQQVIQTQMRGRQLPPEIMPNYVPQFINSMITERALEFEARRLGFKVSDEELATAIRSFIPQLFQGGKFAGKDAYAGILAQQNLTIPQFEADVARQLLVTKLKNIALEGAIVTPQEIEQQYKHNHEKVKVEYVKISQDSVRAEGQVSPEELRKYYQDNQAAYQVPEKRDLGILVIDQAKLEQSLQPTEAQLLRAYNENKDNYRTPERVKVRHILLKADEKNAQQQATVKAKAEGLLKQLKAGANFGELAKKNSEDTTSAVNGGDLPDWIVKGQTVPEFEKFAFSAKPGELSDLVKTVYGYHIIQVIAHEQPRLKPFADVKAQLAVEYKKQRVNDLMQETADKAQAALAKDPQHPDKVAADLGIQLVKAANIAPNDPLPEVGVNREFNDSIAALKKGEVSQPVVVTGNKIALAVCTGVIATHPAAFEEVQEQVRTAAVNAKLTRLVDQRATQLADKTRALNGDLAAAAKALKLEAKTSGEVDRAGSIEGLGSATFIAEAFNDQPGTVFGPISIPSAKLVGKVLARIPADMSGLAAQRDAIRNDIRGRQNQNRGSLFEEGVRDALTKEGKIKVHQDVVNRLLASYHG